MEFDLAAVDIAAVDGEAASLMVGGDDDQGVFVRLREFEGFRDRHIKVEGLADRVLSVVVVVRPVDLTALDHNDKALFALLEQIDGPRGHLGDGRLGTHGLHPLVGEEAEHPRPRGGHQFSAGADDRIIIGTGEVEEVALVRPAAA